MHPPSPTRAAVLGAGTMGHGIAQVAALAGWRVALHDVAPGAVQAGLDRIRQSLDKGVAKGKTSREDAEGAWNRLETAVDLEAAVAGADLVVEAAPERLEIKREIFERIARAAPETALLATNTSSLSISEIAGATPCPERVAGMHFFNPVPVMALLEVVRGEKTSGETVARAVAIGEGMGKTPIVVRDVPGFASSRLGVHLGLEAIRMVEEGVAAPDAIDTAMELGYRHPMGPLKLTDLVGLDVRLAIAEHLEHTLGPRFRPPDLMRRMVAEGHLGQKAGRGFYVWEGRKPRVPSPQGA